MDSGRFAIILVIVVVLIGGLGYYENLQTANLGSRIDAVQAKAENAETSAKQAQAAAGEARTAVATLTAGSPKAADIQTLVKQATDAAAAAAQAADQAKQAAADAAKAPAAKSRK
jgi:hypothetical protein